MDGLDVKVARIRCRLTQLELGRLAGIKQERLSNIENGLRPIPDKLIAVIQRELEAKGFVADAERP